MSSKAKGKRAKTRDLFKRRHSKLSVSMLLRPFGVGQRVQININSSFHGGMPFRRFQNLAGNIVEQRGSSFVVSVLHGGKEKQVIVSAAHLVECK